MILPQNKKKNFIPNHPGELDSITSAMNVGPKQHPSGIIQEGKGGRVGKLLIVPFGAGYETPSGAEMGRAKREYRARGWWSILDQDYVQQGGCSDDGMV